MTGLVKRVPVGTGLDPRLRGDDGKRILNDAPGIHSPSLGRLAARNLKLET